MSDSQLTEDIVCNLCGSDDAAVLFQKGKAQDARIVRCKTCALIYASPRARPADAEIYEQDEPEGLLVGVSKDPTHPLRWRFEKESGQVRDFDASRKILKKLYPDGGSMVEVGSSMGCLLSEFKGDGWDVLGVDPWREVPIVSKEAFDILTLPVTLDQAKLPNASVDVVVMLHVIEHVPDPHATLMEINRILKPGGHMVLETPRYDTLMFKLLQHRERSVKCEGHIYFFTFETLRRAYEKAGFAEVDTRAVGRTMSLERFMWNVGTVLGRSSLRDGLGRFCRKFGLNRVRFTLNLRDMQRVVARKV